ncbi:hypothetical protein [Anaeromyxobacter oryzae]|uniref:Outer membrane protein beta-barrel domain-containing protein n=1 Tax=Anaeromyxobacter oryzae TaxID=2918170 RepID=A0ABN6MYX1_9BACT|nr:hypothetical protein [Anaeromyxobacter oryzae]BDG06140.1 hypothetical protein AMOR_51360 [Anaeromyxobacter oryzae]
MRTRSIVLLALLALPALATAQYDPNAPPPPPPPYGPPPYGPPRGRPPQHDTGLVVAARVGYAFPGGKISDEGDPRLDDLLEYKIPIWFELGYRFNPALWGGFYFEYAPMSVNRDFCVAGRSCDGQSFRFGVDMQFHLAPHRPVDPWLGFGIGWEFISADAFDSTVGNISTFSYDGLEFPLLEAGLDLALSPRFALGPFISYSMAEFSSFNISTPGFADISGDIHGRAFHSWLQLGLKGTFKL